MLQAVELDLRRQRIDRRPRHLRAQAIVNATALHETEVEQAAVEQHAEDDPARAEQGQQAATRLPRPQPYGNGDDADDHPQ